MIVGCLRAIALLFVPALAMATTASAPAGFRILLKLANSGETASVTLRCTDGCAWTASTIECPRGPAGCVAHFTNYAGPASPRTATAAPVSPEPNGEEKVAWLGVVLNATEQVATAENVVVARVSDKSPASAAGFRNGDVVREFNYAPVQVPQDLVDAVHGSAPGEAFHALVERDGTWVTLRGTLGEGTRPLEQAPDQRTAIEFDVAAPAREPWPFRLEFEPPVGAVMLYCSEGCAWTRLSLACGREQPRCPIAVDQNGTTE